MRKQEEEDADCKKKEEEEDSLTPGNVSKNVHDVMMMMLMQQISPLLAPHLVLQKNTSLD